MTQDAPAGQPLHRLLALYLLIATPPLLLPQRPAAWPLLLALHALAFLIAFPPGFLRAGLERARSAFPRLLRFLLDWYPVALIPALYTELAPLNAAVHGGHYFDDIVLGWEQAVFGGQPSRDLAAAAPRLWLSELLHGGYLSYYFIIYVPPILLYATGRYADFRRAVFALMLAFFLHYVFFIYFPVQGPRYLFPAPGGVLAEGPLYRFTHMLLEAGSSQGAAFPSSHVGVSVAQTVIAFRFLGRLAPVLGLLTLMLALGAVYGGFHYAIDAVCGALLGGLAVLLAPHAYRVLGGRARGGRVA
ncbi:MAG TPA: phosphatase PAP2 family protein [Longimicrobiales bacterium]|nr:phosphatase PAP2 family protein [Longimicrobiales bacterium]